MSRKGQEEIVGFVSIIVVVTIVGIILLAFLIRNDSSEINKDNRDLLRFLESALTYTSECTVDYGYTYKTNKELTRLCYQKPDTMCLNNKDVCEVLNETLNGILISAWGLVDNSTFVRGYTYTSTFSRNFTELETEEFLKIEEGKCTRNTRSYSVPVSTNPNIDARIKLCLAE